MSPKKNTDKKDQPLHLGYFPDEEVAKELAEQVLALSPAGRSLVVEKMVRDKAYPVVANACEELGLSGVLEQMAVWCHRGWIIHTDSAKHTEATLDRWQETLLRAFQQALAGPPSRD